MYKSSFFTSHGAIPHDMKNFAPTQENSMRAGARLFTELSVLPLPKHEERCKCGDQSLEPTVGNVSKESVR